jgi:RHS repeat-associated protein
MQWIHSVRSGASPVCDAEKFATCYRDTKTGLDYAMNRYYWSGLGRFLTADPYTDSAGSLDSQSWNRYLYTRGDPLNRTDRNGLEDQSADENGNGETPVDCGPFGLIPEGPCRSFLQASALPPGQESPPRESGRSDEDQSGGRRSREVTPIDRL